MSDINPSLVSSELTTIETFKDTTEKRGSKLTLNELNYISDKQLHSKGGSGGSSSPVGLAKVKFVADDPKMTFDSCFSGLLDLPTYMPVNEDYAETACSYPSDGTLTDWNTKIDNESAFLITPCILYKMGDAYTYTLEGNAEFGSDHGGDYIKITGDCTIKANRSQQE